MSNIMQNLASGAGGAITQGSSVLFKNWLQIAVSLLLGVQGYEAINKNSSVLASEVEKIGRRLENSVVAINKSHERLNTVINDIELNNGSWVNVPQQITNLDIDVTRLIQDVQNVKLSFNQQLHFIDKQLYSLNGNYQLNNSELNQFKLILTDNQSGIHKVAKELEGVLAFTTLFQHTNMLVVSSIGELNNQLKSGIVDQQIAFIKHEQNRLKDNTEH